MSALARYLHIKGFKVSGSDKESSALLLDLENEGIKNIWTPHSKQTIASINPDIIIYSTAVTNENEEMLWAKENKKEALHRSDLLKLITEDKKTISISGTHGKTTTSAMILNMLNNSDLKPSGIIGGILTDKNTNVIVGTGEYFVIEADESDKSFLKGDPEIAIITNIEADHLENYSGGLEEIKKSFLEFAKKAHSKRALVFCLQDKITREIITNNFDLNDSKLISYGISDKCNAMTQAKFNQEKNQWDIYYKNKILTSIKPIVPGEHYILNALAAFSVGHLLGISPEKTKATLESYTGVKRRFEVIGKTKDITIIDDYAHHPTEIASTIKAAKELNPKRLIVVLQPHQPLRLRDLWKDFVGLFKNEDSTVFITETYIARGTDIEGISSQKLVKEINKPNVNYLPGDISETASQITKLVKPGDLILIMGAGNITNLGPKLLKSNEALASKFGNN